MSENKEHFRHIMLFNFRKGKNASQTCEEICSVYGAEAVDQSTCRKWFRRFRMGNFDVVDAYRAGRPVTTDVDKIKTMIDNDRRLTTREIALALNITATTVSRHLSKLGMVKQLDVWVPLQVNENSVTKQNTNPDICRTVGNVTEQYTNRNITKTENLNDQT